MKVTIDLPDDLFRSVELRAAEEGTSMRLLVIQALSRELQQQPTFTSRRVKLPLVTLPDRVILPVLTNADIDEVTH